MQRRDFLTLGGLAFAGLALPGTRVIAAEALLAEIRDELRKGRG